MSIDDRLFVGNIMENWSLDNNKDELTIKKESALLYKTKTGAYVDLDEVKEASKFLRWELKKVDKINIKGNNKMNDKNILIMPGLPASQAQQANELGFLGIFVDEESLMPYKELKEKEKETKTM